MATKSPPQEWHGDPILKVPLDSKDIKKLHISQAWGYQNGEKNIHGLSDHPAIDIAGPRLTAVYAPIAGFALRSFQQRTLMREDDPTKPVLYQEKEICYSLGRFVQIWDPRHDLYFLFGHFEQTNPSIPYLDPTEGTNGLYNPELLNVQPSELEKHCDYIRRGVILGLMGTSGLGWGYTETPGNSPDPKTHPTWDEAGPHLHMEVFTRKLDEESKMVKDVRYDPFGLYRKDVEVYDAILHGQAQTPHTLSMWVSKGKQLSFAV